MSSHLFSVFFDEDGRVGINSITERVIGASFKVANTLGSGFLEKVYENAIAHELRKIGFAVEQQKPIAVFYEGIVVGKYEPDLLVEGRVIVELKAVGALNDVHRAQCLNYLRATGFDVCLLINFGNPKVEIKRIAL